jgi:predicted hotdog family 3-hydroxylacyl-ACP dehydratase
MVLLDRVIEADGSHIVCEVAIRVDSQFCNGATVPGWVGIEYMAQTIGVLTGWQALAKQSPVRIGFLVGTRHYQSHVSEFHVGDVLRITADEELIADNGLALMRCKLHSATGALLAEASLLVFQPDDLDAYLHHNQNASAKTLALK